MVLLNTWKRTRNKMTEQEIPKWALEKAKEVLHGFTHYKNPKLRIDDTLEVRIAQALAESQPKLPSEFWDKLKEVQRCPNPHCNDTGAYPIPPDGDAEQCEFCWANKKSFFNLKSHMEKDQK